MQPKYATRRFLSSKQKFKGLSSAYPIRNYILVRTTRMMQILLNSAKQARRRSPVIFEFFKPRRKHKHLFPENVRL